MITAHASETIGRGLPRVALVVETTRAYGRRILQGIADYVRENGPWLVHTEPRALFDPAPKWLARWKGEGIIARVADERSARMLQNTGIPVVNLKASADTCLGPPPVFNDQQAIGRMGAEHLLERGFTHFGFLGVPGHPPFEGRLAGFRDRVERAGYTCRQSPGRPHSLNRYRDGSFGEEIDFIAGWLAEEPKPLGVMAADDFLGLQLLDACRLARIAVPEEVAVLGVDDETMVCEMACPPLTSIVPDNVRVGREAAALLDRLMHGGSPPAEPLAVPPLGIVTRQSSDVMAIADPLVAKAMQFIRENACNDIQVQDVLRRLVVSPSTLQRRFQKVLGRTLHEAIVSTRLARVKQLLSESQLPLKQIAMRAGFKHVEHMSAVFKQHTGLTLNEYRKQRGHGGAQVFDRRRNG